MDRLTPSLFLSLAKKVGAPRGCLCDPGNYTIKTRIQQVPVIPGSQVSHICQRLPNLPRAWSLSLEAWETMWSASLDFPCFPDFSSDTAFSVAWWVSWVGFWAVLAEEWFTLLVDSFTSGWKLWDDGVSQALWLLHGVAQGLTDWEEIRAHTFALPFTPCESLGNLITPPLPP